MLKGIERVGLFVISASLSWLLRIEWKGSYFYGGRKEVGRGCWQELRVVTGFHWLSTFAGLGKETSCWAMQSKLPAIWGWMAVHWELSLQGFPTPFLMTLSLFIFTLLYYKDNSQHLSSVIPLLWFIIRRNILWSSIVALTPSSHSPCHFLSV